MNEENHEPRVGPFPGVMGPHTARAVERLKEGKPGDTVTRDEMAQVIGRNCESNSLGYGNVGSAIRRVRNDHGIVWAWSRHSQVWQCLNAAQRVKAQGGKNRRGSRQFKDGVQIGLTVDASDLDDEQRQEHGLNQAAAGMALLCGGGVFRRRLKATGATKWQEADVPKLIELMKRDKSG